jgi:hypothetical protein
MDAGSRGLLMRERFRPCGQQWTGRRGDSEWADGGWGNRQWGQWSGNRGRGLIA